MVIFFTLLSGEKEEIIISPWGKSVFFEIREERRFVRGRMHRASIGEMPGSRQRRLHRSDKFQLSLRQRDCTSIRETKLFPFHGKRKEKEGQVSSKSAAASFSRFNPLDCLFITRATCIEIRLSFTRRLTTDGIRARSRHVSRRFAIPRRNGASIVQSPP